MREPAVFREWERSEDPVKRAHVAAVRAIKAGAGFPPLREQAGNLTSAVIAAVRSGGKRTTPAERERRLSICAGCEHFAAEEVRCRRCGCRLNLKVRLEAWSCPLGLW